MRRAERAGRNLRTVKSTILAPRRHKVTKQQASPHFTEEKAKTHRVMGQVE